MVLNYVGVLLVAKVVDASFVQYSDDFEDQESNESSFFLLLNYLVRFYF